MLDKDGCKEGEAKVAAWGSTESTGAQTCRDCDQDSSILRKQDYQGADLIKGGLRASSSKECCKNCRANAKCKFWTHGTTGNRKGTCWLKADSTGREAQDNRDSGKICRTAADVDPLHEDGECKDCKFTQNILYGEDYQGADLIKGGVKAWGPPDCCIKCRANPQCRYWSFGNAGSRKGTCWLKNDQTGRETQTNRDSGKVCREAPKQSASTAEKSSDAVMCHCVNPGAGVTKNEIKCSDGESQQCKVDEQCFATGDFEK